MFTTALDLISTLLSVITIRPPAPSMATLLWIEVLSIRHLLLATRYTAPPYEAVLLVNVALRRIRREDHEA